jgi:cell wall-associated NlpC family hydrolase
MAETIASAQARAAQVQSQVDALRTKAEIASEQYNAAQSQYSSLTKQVRSSRATIKKLDARRSALQKSLDTRAGVMYRQGPLGFLNVVLNTHSLSDFDAALQIMTNMNQKDAVNVQQLKDAKEKAAKAQALLVRQQAAAGEQQRAMADNARQVKAHLAASTQVLAQADSTVKALIAQKAAEEAAAARAEARRVLAEQAAAERQRASESDSGSSGSDSSSDEGGNPPTSSKGAAAVYWAQKKLGCPYVWAAAGPNTFDCSGLTMWAYKKVGISLPHYSRAQINVGSRVSKSNLQPGDLVFFGSPIHHVGMYVGSGSFIEAPYSGSHVRITKLSKRHDFAGASRP